ncbi:MAG TPA: prenyltransferase/squalene oxidase repeat-containing protein [Planctomycetota bacterium]|jgi:hypothetical protein
MRLTFAALAVALCAPLGRTQDALPPRECTPLQEKSIARGLKWLRDIQNNHGTWGCEKSGAPSTAITGLAALALAAAGSTPRSGEHQEAIERAIAGLLRAQGRNGCITQNDSTGMGLFYDHSCATLALAEFYGMQKEPGEVEGLVTGLKDAVAYLYTRQNRDGGWSAVGSGDDSDLAITCSVWLALRAAHNAGVTIETARVDKVEEFVRKCRDPRGGFKQYPSVRGGGGRMFYPTSAGLRILLGLGRRDMKEVERGLEVLLSKKLGDDYGGKISEWDYCGGFFAVMALLHENGRAWKTWYPKLRDQLIKLQNPDGSWTIEYCLCCRAYATALALLMLECPNRVLPLFQL